MNNPTDTIQPFSKSILIWSLLETLLWPAAAAVSLSFAIGAREVTPIGLLLVASGTMAAYGLDRYIDNRRADSLELRRTLAGCVIIASAVTAALACTAWWRFQVCCVLAVIAGAYVPLKLRIPKNVLTTIAWTAATSTLPFSGIPLSDPAYSGSVVAVALIMLANTIVCDIPDFHADQKSGVKGITPRFGPRVGGMAAAIFGSAGAVIAILVGRWGLALTSVGLVVVAFLHATQSDERLYRRLADAIVTFVPGPIAFLFR